jgi:hypothetical protein
MSTLVRFKCPFFILASLTLLQIFEDGATYRGQLKTLCRNLTAVHLTSDLTPHIEHSHNQLEYYELVKDNVKKLLKKAFFLQGGQDENVLVHSFKPLLSTDFIIGRGKLVTLDTPSSQTCAKSSTTMENQIALVLYSQTISKSSHANV